jgi:hypothetical protein
MLSLEIPRSLLSTETQKTLSLPMAALIVGALSHVDNLIELAERVCDPLVRRPATMTDSAVRWPIPARAARSPLASRSSTMRMEG